jgi:hypothetical protein
MIEWLREELGRTLPHGLNPHLDIVVSGNEDNRDNAFLFFKPDLQLQSGDLRHKDVSDHTCRATMQIGFKEFFR